MRTFSPWLAIMVGIPCNFSGLRAAAQMAGYDLSWRTVDAGGVTFGAGGGYSLGGTAGQPDAGRHNAGGYALSGGFWFQDVGCTTNTQCDDAQLCTFDQCASNACANTPRRYADVNFDGFVNLTDELCVRDIFEGFPSSPACNGAPSAAADIAPCPAAGDPDNMGDGFVNGDDSLAILDTFSGNPLAPTFACAVACPVLVPASLPSAYAHAEPSPGWVSNEGGAPATATLTLLPTKRIIDAGDSLDIDVYIAGAPDLRAYQVAVEAHALPKGHLTLQSLQVDAMRPDLAFVPLGAAHSLERRALFSALPRGSVDASAPTYLATFTFRASADAQGACRLNTDPRETLLHNAAAAAVAVKTVGTMVLVRPASEARSTTTSIRRSY